MRKEKIMRKALSLLLSAITALTLISPAACVSYAAEDVTRTLPRAINGVIRAEAENAYSSDANEPSSDGEASTVVSFMQGDTMKYKVIVRFDGEYILKMRSASSGGEASALFSAGGSQAAVNISPTGSWTDYAINEAEEKLTLGNGINEITVYMETGAVSFDYFTLEYAGDRAKNTLELENPDYWEIGENQSGDMFFDENGNAQTSLSYMAYPFGGASGGWEAGVNSSLAEWVFNAEQSGLYTFSFKYETELSVSVSLKIDGRAVTDALALSPTGRWNPTSSDWSSAIVAENVPLDRGTHILSFYLEGSATCDCITFEKTGEISDRSPIVREAVGFDLLAGQGEGYYDTTSDVIDNAAMYLEKYFPVEAGYAGENIVVGMAPGEWLKYNVYVENAGRYRLSAATASMMNTSMSASVNGSEGREYSVPSSNSWTELTYTSLGSFNLEEGDNTVIIKNLGDSCNFGFFKLEASDGDDPEPMPDPDPDTDMETVRLEMENPENASHDVLDESQFLYRKYPYSVCSGGYAAGMNIGVWGEWTVNIENGGSYEIYFKCATPDDNYVSVSLDGKDILTNAKTSVSGSYSPDDAMVTDILGTAELSSGSHTIRVTKGGGGCTADYMELRKIKRDIAVTGVHRRGGEINDGDIIPRGTDYIAVYFNNYIDESKLSSAKISLDGNGGSVPLDIEVNGKVLNIYLLRQIDYDSEYTLTVDGVESRFLPMPEPYSVTFTASDANGDSGASSVSITEAKMNYENAVFRGYVLSAEKKKIGGRKAELIFDGKAAASTVSGENGEFELKLTMPDGAAPGVYDFYINAEYASKAEPIALSYISKEYESEMLLALKNTKTAAEVSDWFDSYSDILLIDSESDMQALSDKDVFYKGFIGRELSSADEFKQDYYKALYLEMLNQGDEAVILSVLSDAEKLKALGFDIDYIPTDMDGFLQDLKNMDRKDTAEEYYSALCALKNTYLAKKFEKDIPSLDVQRNVNVYTGGGIKVPVKFENKLTDVKSVKLVFDGADFVSTISLSHISGSAKCEKSGSSASLEISGFGGKPVQDLGYVLFTAPQSSGSHKISVAAEVKYECTSDGKAYEFSLNPEKEEISVAVSKSSYNDKGGGSSGGGGGSSGGSSSGGSGSTIGLPSDNTQKPQQEAFAFTDLEGVSWAGESINYLLKNNVVSESEDKLFYPNRNVTREEFVKMAAAALGLSGDGYAAEFTDVEQSAWYYQPVCAAVKYGIITGRDDGSFGTGENITREDMAAIAGRILEKAGLKAQDGAQEFADDYLISDYAKSFVYGMRSLGVMSGTGDNMFEPKNNATRAMAAKVIFEIMKAVGR